MEKELFWGAELEDLKKGYLEDENFFKCIICEEEFEKGQIYNCNSKLYEAEKACKIHLEEKHGSMLEYLINMNSKFTGISDVQKEIITLMAEGISDKEMAVKLGVAPSTIRNHRYKLREKEKQAKLFLTMMELLSNNTNKKITKLDDTEICDAHKTAAQVDDRFNITEKEIEAVKKAYFTEEGGIKNFPSKEKKKIIVLRIIAANFKTGTTYSEQEINRILKRIYEDYVTIRRAMIEYGFLSRTDDCKKYWVKE